MSSIRVKFFLEKVLFGLDMVALGIVQQAIAGGWDSPLVMLLTGSVILAYFVFDFRLIDKIKFEPVDEMTKQHEYKAQAGTYMLGCKILGIFGLACMISSDLRIIVYSLHFSWWYIFYLMGILQIVEYMVFIGIERRGDPIE